MQLKSLLRKNNGVYKLVNAGFNLKEEVKCDFKITAKRKKLWAEELELLSEYNRICDKYGIKYFFIGGSAIGVERHKGFIPWDDDIDIGMLRSDFEKFITVAKKELSDSAFLQYGADNIEEASWFCRIRKNGTTGIIRGQLKQNCNHGVFIELYPFDEVPPSKVAQYVQIELASLFRQLFTCRCSHVKSSGLLKVIEPFFKWMSTEKIFQVYDSICRRYNGKGYKMVNTVSMANYAKTGECYYCIDDVKNTVKKEFENTKVQVATGNDKILRVCYGDYMQLPKIEDRGAHHNTQIYYDPDIDYKTALESGLPQRFFAGEYELGQF